jgi:ABC-type dipeptide/oligopeptide/nickel transport system permease subunit
MQSEGIAKTETPPGAEPAAGPTRTRAEWRRALRSLRKSRAALVGVLVLAVVVAVAVGAPWIAPHNPNEQVLERRLLPPAWIEGGVRAHPIGTDHLGRDILSRMIYGSRISLAVGFSAVLISGLLGIAAGLIAGYYGRAYEAAIMRLVDIQLAFPFILLALAIIGVLGPGLRNVILVLGVAGWMVYARVVRGQTLSIREREFVEAARAIGAGDFRIIRRHVLPNTLAPVIIVATFAVATCIITEASLTFFGLGVEATIPTWGSMLSDGRAYMGTAWWLTTFPGLAMMLTVLALNVIGDWLREYIDPRMRNL